MADALAVLLKEFVDAFKRYCETPVAGTLHNSSMALHNHLISILQVSENDEEVQALSKRAIYLVNRIGLEFEQLGYENGEEVRDLLIGAGTSWEGFIQDRKRRIDEIVGVCEKLCKVKYSSNIEVGEEVVVGIDEDVETLLDQLTTTCIKQLQVITIAGMAGLGKTTLARKLYNDPLVEYFFDFRAWTCVSQVYLIKDLLLGILSSFIHELTDEIYKMSDTQLGEKLYRLLKGRKYLVVLDDIQDSKAWNDLKIYFPDDKTGSRVLFTSRDIDIISQVQAARPAHVLRLRTEAESWDLFQRKIFRFGVCPLSLEDFGRVITRKCEGLPLAIVIASGLLKKTLSNEWWGQIAEKLSLFMSSSPSRYMDSLALSYNHLPPHLKPCFLFFGSFPEDYEVPVTKLIWLWIAQGFIHQSGSKILEDVAEDFLMDLINRCLLMCSKKRADGRIEACRIHDLLRDLCLRKADEEKFSLLSYNYALVVSFQHPPLLSTLVCAIHMSWAIFFKKVHQFIMKDTKQLGFLIWSMSLSLYFLPM